MLGNVMDKMGIPPEMIENMESMEGDINDYLTQNGLVPSDNDDSEDGGAPAIPLPRLFETPASNDGGIVPAEKSQNDRISRQP